MFHKNTAIEKIRILLDKVLTFRNTEEQRLVNSTELTTGDVTTVNVTTINGGIQQNVVPPEITMSVDVRMSVTIDHEQFERDIHDWCNQAGQGIHIEFIDKLQRIEPTKLDANNPYWIAFKEVLVDDLSVVKYFHFRRFIIDKFTLFHLQKIQNSTTNISRCYG